MSQLNQTPYPSLKQGKPRTINTLHHHTWLICEIYVLTLINVTYKGCVSPCLCCVFCKHEDLQCLRPMQEGAQEERKRQSATEEQGLGIGQETAEEKPGEV